MSDRSLQISLMKLLSTKHFPLQSPRPKVKLEKIVAALGRIGADGATVEQVFENMTELKGRGYVNTEPKIIMKDEFDTAEFQVWLTPLGRTELEKMLSS